MYISVLKSHLPLFPFFRDLFIYVYEQYFHVCLHDKRGHQIALHIDGLTHHVGAGNVTQDLCTSIQCS